MLDNPIIQHAAGERLRNSITRSQSSLNQDDISGSVPMRKLRSSIVAKEKASSRSSLRGLQSKMNRSSLLRSQDSLNSATVRAQESNEDDEDEKTNIQGIQSNGIVRPIYGKLTKKRSSQRSLSLSLGSRALLIKQPQEKKEDLIKQSEEVIVKKIIINGPATFDPEKTITMLHNMEFTPDLHASLILGSVYKTPLKNNDTHDKNNRLSDNKSGIEKDIEVKKINNELLSIDGIPTLLDLSPIPPKIAKGLSYKQQELTAKMVWCALRNPPPLPSTSTTTNFDKTEIVPKVSSRKEPLKFDKDNVLEILRQDDGGGLQKHDTFAELGGRLSTFSELSSMKGSGYSPGLSKSQSHKSVRSSMLNKSIAYAETPYDLFDALDNWMGRPALKKKLMGKRSQSDPILETLHNGMHEYFKAIDIRRKLRRRELKETHDLRQNFLHAGGFLGVGELEAIVPEHNPSTGSPKSRASAKTSKSPNSRGDNNIPDNAQGTKRIGIKQQGAKANEVIISEACEGIRLLLDQLRSGKVVAGFPRMDFLEKSEEHTKEEKNQEDQQNTLLEPKSPRIGKGKDRKKDLQPVSPKNPPIRGSEVIPPRASHIVVPRSSHIVPPRGSQIVPQRSSQVVQARSSQVVQARSSQLKNGRISKNFTSSTELAAIKSGRKISKNASPITSISMTGTRPKIEKKLSQNFHNKGYDDDSEIGDETDDPRFKKLKGKRNRVGPSQEKKVIEYPVSMIECRPLWIIWRSLGGKINTSIDTTTINQFLAEKHIFIIKHSGSARRWIKLEELARYLYSKASETHLTQIKEWLEELAFDDRRLSTPPLLPPEVCNELSNVYSYITSDEFVDEEDDDGLKFEKTLVTPARLGRIGFIDLHGSQEILKQFNFNLHTHLTLRDFLSLMCPVGYIPFADSKIGVNETGSVITKEDGFGWHVNDNLNAREKQIMMKKMGKDHIIPPKKLRQVNVTAFEEDKKKARRVMLVAED